MQRFFGIYVIILFSIVGKAQENSQTYSDTLQSQRLLTIINFNRDQTYATFAGGLGNQVPLIFEAQFSPSYFISSNKKKWAFMMNPQAHVTSAEIHASNGVIHVIDKVLLPKA